MKLVALLYFVLLCVPLVCYLSLHCIALCCSVLLCIASICLVSLCAFAWHCFALLCLAFICIVSCALFSCALHCVAHLHCITLCVSHLSSLHYRCHMYQLVLFLFGCSDSLSLFRRAHLQPRQLHVYFPTQMCQSQQTKLASYAHA